MIMKRRVLEMALVSLFAIIAFSSCEKDDDGNGGNSIVKDNTITAEVEDGSDYDDLIDEVRVSFMGSNYKTAGFDFINGGFVLELDPEVDDQYLTTLENRLDIPEDAGGVKVSNRKVKIEIGQIEAYGSRSYRVGSIFHGTKDWEGILTYANGDVDVTGSVTGKEEDYTFTLKYNLHLKKGWNMMYEKETESKNNESVEYTSQVPSGARWYFEEW
jgi:hypothetical protein